MTVTSMPEPATGTGGEVVLGVDTHRDRHAVAVVTVSGALLATAAFPATAAGYRRLLDWASGHGRLRRAGVECTGSYGAGLSRLLQAEGVHVLDVNQPDKRIRRTRGKTDTVDAEAAARAVVCGRATVIAKTGTGSVEAIRVLKTARDSAVHAGAKAINQLKAILVSAHPELREAMTGLGTGTLIRRCAQLTDPDQQHGAADQAVVYTLRLLAERILRLKAEAYTLEKRITALVRAHAPRLLDRRGVGPDSAAALLIAAGDNPDRLAGEASYAALCGTSPVEASSGITQRRRLNRGGDRQANAALYRIAQSRLRWHPPTQNYLRRRLAEGKTRREIIRCIKRYLARELFPLLHTSPPSTIEAAAA
jgi:transposase